jgi:tetratricopeptide repeat protein 21B
VAIARVYQSQGNNQQCESYCNKALGIDKSNEEATYMKAKLMLLSEKSDNAIKSYIDLLEKEPDNFNILAQLIELLRKLGRISEIPKYLEQAEQNT